MFRLTDKQAKILSCAMLQADASAMEIARQTGCREHLVRRCLDELTAEGIIKRFPIVNIHALGLTDYCLFFSVPVQRKLPRKKLLNALVDSPQTAWVAELAGEYQYTASLFARDIFEVEDFLSQLTRRCGGAILEKSFAVRVSWTSFRCKYLDAGSAAVNEVVRGKPRELVSLDHDDMRILAELCRSPELSQTKLARALSMSSSTLSYRINGLKKKGAIAGFVYYVDAAALGMFPARLLVYEAYSNPALGEKLHTFAKNHRLVTAFVRCIGNWDYELNVEVAHPRQLAEITEELASSVGDSIENIKVVTLLQTVKINLFPFAKASFPRLSTL